VLKQTAPAPNWEEIEPSSLAPCEVNVLFTDARATRTALEAATTLAKDLMPFQQNSLDITPHLYLSRDRIETLLQVLQSNALVILAGRKRPWPTAESRMAKRLQVEGHRVVFLPLRKGD
jgi:hypothetical protein